jgi:hypothetical protein
MTLLWLVAVGSLVAALLAWRKARATARRLEQLTQLYWELKYQHGELRVRLQRTAGPDAGGGSGSPEAAGPANVPAAPPSEGFIPLSALKR